MIRRLALTAGFAVLGAVAFAPNASAQAVDETVQFTGTVESSCSFTPAEAGVLALSDAKTLTSTATEGTAGTTSVNCSTGGIISVAEPVPQGETPTGDFILTASVSNAIDSTLSADSDNPDSSFDVNAGEEVGLNVDMTVSDTENLPAGDYTYEVTVTATPN